jgi:hypothetical protein
MAEIPAPNYQNPELNRLISTPSNGPQQIQQWQGVSQQQLQLGLQRLQATNQIFGAIAAKQNPTMEDVMAAATALRQIGVPSTHIAQGLSDFAGKDPAGIKAEAFRHITRNMSIEQQMRSGYGSTELVDNGQQKLPVQVRQGPGGGVFPAGGSPIQNQLTPSDAASPMPGPPNARNQPTVIPKGKFAEDAGTAAPGTYVRPGGGAPMPVAPAPGAAESQQETAVAGARQGLDLQKSAEGVPTRKGMLANLETDLDQFTAGPGADWQNVSKAWANRNVLPQSFQFDPKSIASQEMFTKQATQLAQQQFGALGGTGTDAKLDSAIKTNPSTALSDMGNRGIIQLLKGNEDAINAKNQAWQKWKTTHGADTYDQFTTKFNKVYNPLVFQAQYMNPEEVRKLRTKLSEPDRKRFEEGYRIAKGNNWLGGGSDAPSQ